MNNASGSAALLSLARTFAKATPDRTLRFVFFTNEEYFRQGLMGSLVYAKLCRARGDNIVAMLSLETIGYYSDVAEARSIRFRSICFTRPWVTFWVSRKCTVTLAGARGHRFVPQGGNAGVDRSGRARIIDGNRLVDQWSFWRQGYRGS